MEAKEIPTDIKKAVDQINRDEEFEVKFEDYLNNIFYVKNPKPTKCDSSIIEYFGVFSIVLKDLRNPERKLWYIYYSPQSKIDEKVAHIQTKFGKKNVYEIFRKPIFCGHSMRAIVKKHFAELKWYTNDNVLEAPPKSHYNDGRLIKTVTDLYNAERQKLYNYVILKHSSYNKYR